MDHSNWLHGGSASIGVHFLSLNYFVHCIAFYCSLVLVKHFVFLRKLFLDLSQKCFASTSCIRCLLSCIILVLLVYSKLLRIFLKKIVGADIYLIRKKTPNYALDFVRFCYPVFTFCKSLFGEHATWLYTARYFVTLFVNYV